MKKLLLSILILMLFPFFPLCLDSVDEFVLENLHLEVKNADKILCFAGPTETTNPMPDFKVGLGGISDKDIVGVFLNNIDVTSQSKMTSSGTGALEINYEPKEPLREGYHAFIVKAKKKGSGIIQSSFFLIKIETNSSKAEELNKTKLDPRVAHIFSDLFSVQHKIKGLFAKVKETAEDMGSKKSFTVNGSLKVYGWDDFRVAMNKPPSLSFEESKRSSNRNILGALNLASYLDYEALYNEYNWSIAEDNKDYFLLQGRAKEVSPEKPYQYLILVDKKLTAPVNVETFIGAEDALSTAKVEYKKVDGLPVPFKQTTLCRLRDGKTEKYTFYLDNIKVNKNPDKIFESKFNI